VLATKDYATYITFVAVVIAAYSAVVHSRFGGAALICVPLVGVVVVTAFWNAKSSLHTRSAAPPAILPFPGHIPGLVQHRVDPSGVRGQAVGSPR
jgi:hypothetical protein